MDAEGEQKRGTERDRMQTPAAGVASRENENEEKGGKKKRKESPCAAFLCLPWRESFILVSQRAVDSPKH